MGAREGEAVEEALTVTKSPVFDMARSKSRLAPWPLVRPSEYRFVFVVGENAPQRVRCTALQHHEAATREYSL